MSKKIKTLKANDPVAEYMENHYYVLVVFCHADQEYEALFGDMQAALRFAKAHLDENSINSISKIEEVPIDYFTYSYAT